MRAVANMPGYSFLSVFLDHGFDHQVAAGAAQGGGESVRKCWPRKNSSASHRGGAAGSGERGVDQVVARLRAGDGGRELRRRLALRAARAVTRAKVGVLPCCCCSGREQRQQRQQGERRCIVISGSTCTRKAARSPSWDRPANACGKQTVETDGKVLTDMVRSIAGKKHVCIEEGTHAEWVYELSRAAGRPDRSHDSGEESGQQETTRAMPGNARTRCGAEPSTDQFSRHHTASSLFTRR